MTIVEIIQNFHSRWVDIGSSRSKVKHLFQYYEIYELLWKEDELIQVTRTLAVIIETFLFDIKTLETGL
jgi:hypothetical protein